MFQKIVFFEIVKIYVEPMETRLYTLSIDDDSDCNLNIYTHFLVFLYGNRSLEGVYRCRETIQNIH